jgi:S1-C subfamily serine protease
LSNRWQGNPKLLTGPGSQIGVMLRDIVPGTTTTLGAVVAEVRPMSPAAQADMRVGDILTIFDGENVRRARDLQRLIAETPPGKDVRVTVVREGRSQVLTVTPSSQRLD